MAARLIGQTRHNLEGRYRFFTRVLLATLSIFKEVQVKRVLTHSLAYIITC